MNGLITGASRGVGRAIANPPARPGGRGIVDYVRGGVAAPGGVGRDAGVVAVSEGLQDTKCAFAGAEPARPKGDGRGAERLPEEGSQALELALLFSGGEAALEEAGADVRGVTPSIRVLGVEVGRELGLTGEAAEELAGLGVAQDLRAEEIGGLHAVTEEHRAHPPADALRHAAEGEGIVGPPPRALVALDIDRHEEGDVAGEPREGAAVPIS